VTKRTRLTRILPVAAAAALCALAARGLAANGVTVVVNPGQSKATIVGTPGADDLTITPGAADDEFVITAGPGTTVDGGASVTVSGVKNLVIKTGAGDDRLLFEGTRLARDLTVDLGEGDDSLEMVDAVVRGRSKLFGKAGADSMLIRDQCNLWKIVNIKGGGGPDEIVIRASVVHGFVRIIGGPHADRITLNGVEMADGTELAILGHSGPDWLGVVDCDLRVAVWAGMGLGDDVVTFNHSRFSQTLGIVGGDGNDFLALDDNDWGNNHRPRIDDFEQ
jgi:hypothetical protein